MQSLKVLFALTAASALVACGGGSGDSAASAPSPTPTPTPTPAPAPGVGSNGTLVATVPAAVYADARRRDAFAQLNAVRLGAGAGLLAQATALDTSAQDHADYLTTNGYNTASSPHYETAGLPGYTGDSPFDRMTNAGFAFQSAGEVIGDIGSSSSSSDCVGDLLDTVYHAVLMLGSYVDVGFGYGTGSSAGMCTIDMGSLASGAGLQIPPSGAVVAYPFGGGTVAHGTFRVSNESPRVPTALLPDATAGVPILVGFRNQDLVAAGSSGSVTITQFTLATAAGTAVPGVIMGGPNVKGTNVNADGELTNFGVFIPSSPLAAGTYTVTLHATISGGRALALSTWSFTVAAP